MFLELLQFILLWPTDSTELSSAFGPRLKTSENFRYDFHRGVDIPGELGDSVYATADGEVYRVYEEGSSVYPDGGNVIVLKHMNTEDEIFYSLYLHLDTMLVEEGEAVTEGETIGMMGQSGDTTFTHLHFEIREATACSLEAQLEGGDCSYFGSDPHVNPMAYIAEPNSTAPELEVLSLNPLSVHVSVASDELDFNRIEVVSEGQEKIFDFNTREGFDASSTESLDQDTVDGVLIEPHYFTNGEDLDYAIDFTFNDLGGYDSIRVVDIWGNETVMGSHSFTDISGHWAEDFILFYAEAGFIEGYSDGTFRPDDLINRAELAAILYRGFPDDQELEGGEVSSFSDVDEDSWYFPYVEALRLLGWVEGNPDGSFEPGENINRAEAVQLGLRVHEYFGGETVDFEESYVDVDSSAWYAEAVNQATALGFVEGVDCAEGRCFEPGRSITRAEALKILYYLGY